MKIQLEEENKKSTNKFSLEIFDNTTELVESVCKIFEDMKAKNFKTALENFQIHQHLTPVHFFFLHFEFNLAAGFWEFRKNFRDHKQGKGGRS
jgi:hypothetical protein